MIMRRRSTLVAGAGMLLAAGLGVGYVVTSAGDPGAVRVDTVSSIQTKAAPAPAGATKAVVTSKNACNAVPLTFFADTAAPAVISNVFPVGTKLKITNLDNGKSTTVPVTGVSGSCALLNTAAMDQIREAGKNVVRRNTVEVVQAGKPANPANPAAPAPANPAAPAPAGGGACNGVALTFFADTAAPAVISNVFPVGTKLKITNLDNGKSTTVPVTGVSGSCALLNSAAMDQIREPGKNVVRRNTVQRLN